MNSPIFPTTKGILRKLGGDKISGKVLTYDFSTLTEEDITPNGFVKISDETVDLSKVVEVIGDTGEEKLVYTEFTVGIFDEEFANSCTHSCLFSKEESIPMVMVVTSDKEGLYPVGTYVIYDLLRGYIKFAETVHPIDPKYLAKEINLNTYGIDLATIVYSGQKTAVVEGTKKMWEEIDSGSNVVFTCNFGGGTFTLYPAMNASVNGSRIISMKLQSIDSGYIVDVAIVLHTTVVEGELVDVTNVSCVMTTLCPP